MENQFLEMDSYLVRTNGKANQNGKSSNRLSISKSLEWAKPFSAENRVLVILIENGGIDLGIPDLVDRILTQIPGSSIIPDSLKSSLVDYIRQKLLTATDNLLENIELAANRYTSSKPGLFNDVVILRNPTATYDELKNTLIRLSREKKIIDLFILTHGREDTIAANGDINGQKIKDIKAQNGAPLTIRSVYMINCVGSSLNAAWLDAGAKVSAGTLKNNYLPEPTMFFFWSNWKANQSFENSVTNAYRKTVGLMNNVVKGAIQSLPVPGSGLLADSINFENFDFVRDSSPVIQGQRTLTIESDDLNFAQSQSFSLATTVLPISVIRSLSVSRPFSDDRLQSWTLSAKGIEMIKGFEGFRAAMYNDPVGHCTIGYGTLLHQGNCNGHASEQPFLNGISKEQASALLLEEANGFQRIINDTVKVELNQNQYDSLISFIYNIGAGSFKQSTLLKELNKKNYTAVPGEMRKWTKGRVDGQLVDLPGLVKRRNVEADVFANGNYPSPSESQSYYGRAARSFSGVNYVVEGTIPEITQPSELSCWAAVITMMMSWKNNQSLDITTALSKIDDRYLKMFNAGKGLDKNTAGQLYADAGLVPIFSFNPSIEGWENLLRKYGPLYADVGYSGTFVTHAIIVKGIQGDGTPGGTTITYIDPIPGKTVTISFKNFLEKYEADGAVNWPYTITHWPAGVLSAAKSMSSVQSHYNYESPSLVMSQSQYSYAQNPGVIIAGITVGDALQVGLGAVAVVQSSVAASQGSFSLSYDKAQRMLTSEARAAMPGSQSAKQTYSRELLWIGEMKQGFADASILIEWEGNAYGEIGTAVIRRDIQHSTEWSKSSANTAITKIDKIPLPGTDPRAWPIVYTYEGTFDPAGNGYYEFSGEFEINAFGGLKFTRHEVVSRSFSDFLKMGAPADYVKKRPDTIVPIPAIPQEQINYLRSKLP